MKLHAQRKIFLISIDTEGDYLWRWTPGKPITTENAKSLLRFQNLCDQFGFKPTYLTNYEMASDRWFVDYFGHILQESRCEIGMHLHAWNSPPEYELPVRNDKGWGQPYLIEYPVDIMEQKIAYMTEILSERFGVKPITHRAGRWATNDTYFRLLDEYGYKVDCSVTPGINWEATPGASPGSGGSDYSTYPTKPYRVAGTDLLEIPVTTKESHIMEDIPFYHVRTWAKSVRQAIHGTGRIWCRPNGNNLEQMLWLVDRVCKSQDKYLMFMIHSSELMPGGSPWFPNEESIEHLYHDLTILFDMVSRSFDGMTIGDFAKII